METNSSKRFSEHFKKGSLEPACEFDNLLPRANGLFMGNLKVTAKFKICI